MIRRTGLAAWAFFLGLASVAAQQPARDQSDWPCKQVRVPSLSLAAVWSGPPVDLHKNWREDPPLAELALRLSARRTPLEETEKLVADFAQSAGAARKERLTQLFAAVYDKLDGERGDVIAGLDRYGRAQKLAAERLREKARQLHEAQDAHADAEKVKELGDSLQWDMRLFEERRKAATFACETPALIEQRLGALARTILASIEQ